jgi:hypothetical protein
LSAMSRLNQAAALVTAASRASAALPFCARYWLMRVSICCSSASIACSAGDTEQFVRAEALGKLLRAPTASATETTAPNNALLRVTLTTPPLLRRA